MVDKEVVYEFYCFSCGKFIRQLGVEPQDTQPVILTVYETCVQCALFKAKGGNDEVG